MPDLAEAVAYLNELGQSMHLDYLPEADFWSGEIYFPDYSTAAAADNLGELLISLAEKDFE